MSSPRPGKLKSPFLDGSVSLKRVSVEDRQRLGLGGSPLAGPEAEKDSAQPRLAPRGNQVNPRSADAGTAGTAAVKTTPRRPSGNLTPLASKEELQAALMKRQRSIEMNTKSDSNNNSSSSNATTTPPSRLGLRSNPQRKSAPLVENEVESDNDDNIYDDGGEDNVSQRKSPAPRPGPKPKTAWAPVVEHTVESDDDSIYDEGGDEELNKKAMAPRPGPKPKSKPSQQEEKAVESDDDQIYDEAFGDNETVFTYRRLQLPPQGPPPEIPAWPPKVFLPPLGKRGPHHNSALKEENERKRKSSTATTKSAFAADDATDSKPSVPSRREHKIQQRNQTAPDSDEAEIYDDMFDEDAPMRPLAPVRPPKTPARSPKMTITPSSSEENTPEPPPRPAVAARRAPPTVRPLTPPSPTTEDHYSVAEIDGGGESGGENVYDDNAKPNGSDESSGELYDEHLPETTIAAAKTTTKTTKKGSKLATLLKSKSKMAPEDDGAGRKDADDAADGTGSELASPTSPTDKRAADARRRFNVTEEEMKSEFKAVVKQRVSPKWIKGGDYLSLKEGEEVFIIRMKMKKGGSWLVRTAAGKVGLVDNKHLELKDMEKVKTLARKSVDSKSGADSDVRARADDDEDGELYDEANHKVDDNAICEDDDFDDDFDDDIYDDHENNDDIYDDEICAVEEKLYDLVD